MFVMRPITLQDLDSLEQFANSATLGMISMPKKRKLLEKKIERSIHAFESDIYHPGHEVYLFILENSETGEVGGTCGIYAKTGEIDPLYFYKIDITHPKSEKLQLPEEIQVLHPVKYRNGPAEICGLYMTPGFRKEGLGRLLSLSRLLFIASNPERFDSTIMAQLRGVIYKRDHTSPFWEAIGRQFVDISFVEALGMLDSGRGFIKDFLPQYPVYANLLPKDAQRVIGRTHETTKPALKMLHQEGLRYTQEVDVFDAGPRVVGVRDEIRTIKESRIAFVQSIEESPIETGRMMLIANTRLDFRCCMGRLRRSGDQVILDRALAKSLKVEIGEAIRFVTAR